MKRAVGAMTERAMSRRRARRAVPTHRFAVATGTLFYLSLAIGFVSGLAITVLRESVLPDQFGRDANRIFDIASGRVPDFQDGSYTPVGLTYRALGLGENPDLAALSGYLLASTVLVVALIRSGRRSATVTTSAYIVAAFVLAGVYLGQYSKDVFVLVPVLLLVMLPKSVWWDAFAVAAMLLYAYFFRDYWALVALAYVGFRAVAIWQVRLRYLLIGGSLAAVAIGLAFYFVLGWDPNHFRTAVQGHLDANTLIVPLEPAPQPLGGIVDVFLNYWLLFVPVLLPVLAGPAYLLVLIAYAFVRVTPLLVLRSATRWPGARSLDGALLRRSLALLLAFGVVQAVFEPDYGSALRHFTPLMPLALMLIQSARAGVAREGRARPWTWSGAASAA
ncbi:hypothetical protein [Microbacterium sp. KNMS]